MSAKTKSLPSQNIICLKNKLSWRPEAVSLIQMESDWKPFLKEFGVPGQYFTFDLISIGYEGRSLFLGRESNIWILTASLTIRNVIRHHFEDCQVFLPLHWCYISFSVLFQTNSSLVWKRYTLKMRRIFQTNSSLVWKEKIDFARCRFQTKFRLVWKILMTIVDVLKIPNQIEFGLEKSLAIANVLNLESIPVLIL